MFVAYVQNWPLGRECGVKEAILPPVAGSAHLGKQTLVANPRAEMLSRLVVMVNEMDWGHG